MQEQALRHQDPQEQGVQEMREQSERQEVKEIEKRPEKITLLELAASFGISSRTARRLLRKWRKETKRDEIEPPHSRWEWDPTDPEEAQALEEATIWLESQLQKRRKGQE